LRIGTRVLRTAKQWRQHFLQTGDEMVSLSSARREVFNLLVLEADQSPEKFILAFESLDIGCRDELRARSAKA
jgi:hypothetical protein